MILKGNIIIFGVAFSNLIIWFMFLTTITIVIIPSLLSTDKIKIDNKVSSPSNVFNIVESSVNNIGEYLMKENYIIPQKSIETILNILSKLPYKSIYYIGYADKDLIITLKEKYHISICDWFNRTDISTGFWYEGEEKEGFPLPETPSWMKGVGVQIEGMPRHEVLILDMPYEYILYGKIFAHRKPAEIVFLLGDADSSNFMTPYTWTDEGVRIGRLKTNENIL